MKKSAVVLSIIGAIVGAIGVALAVLSSHYLGAGYTYVAGGKAFVDLMVKGFVPSYKLLFALDMEAGLPYTIGLLVILGLVVVFWLWHLIKLIAKHRPGALFVNIVYLLTGVVVASFLVGAFEKSIYFVSSNGTYDTLLTFIAAKCIDSSGTFAMPKALLIAMPYAIAFIGFILSFIGVCISIGSLKAKEKVAKLAAPKDKQPAPSVEETPASEAAPSEDELRQAVYSEFSDPNAAAPNESQPDAALAAANSPYVVQYINCPMPGAPAPFYQAQQPQPQPAQAAPAPAPVAAPAPSNANEDKPLTARELRGLIRDELLHHDTPEEDLPLTESQVHKLIREELAAYYAGERPEGEEAPVAPKAAPQPAEEESSGDMITSDDLRQIIREEMSISIPNQIEGVKADDVRAIVKEELASEHQDVRQIIKEELAAAKPAQPTREGEATVLARTVDEKIENIRSSQITMEQVRTVVAQELDKRAKAAPAPAPAPAPVKKEEPKPAPAPVPTVIVQLAQAPAPAPAPVKKEEPKPAPTPAPAPIIVAAPAPVAAPAEGDEEESDAKVVRIPFPTRMLSADQELMNNYNELKAEAVSYGLKSRLSNSGDTFRLHTKSYVKITIAGKGLKLYFALAPKDYVNSPIPVKDVSGKNIYKDIPVCFKVRSALSMKRAKQLMADACEKDNLEQGKVEPHNWAAELKDYKPQLGADDD